MLKFAHDEQPSGKDTLKATCINGVNTQQELMPKQWRVVGNVELQASPCLGAVMQIGGKMYRCRENAQNLAYG